MRLYEFFGQFNKADNTASNGPTTPQNTAGSTRGLRNNNPGNIRKSKRNPWVGKIENGTDQAFEQFMYPEFGIRAIMKLLMTYNRKYKLNTISKILNRYSPNSENDTAKYIDFVAKKTGKGPNDALDINDGQTMALLIKAIIHNENGSQPYDDQQISNGIKMAFDQSLCQKFMQTQQGQAAS